MIYVLTLKFYRRFAHEGTRRRSLFSPISNEWKDVTYLGMLDTDWAMRSVTRRRKLAPKSMWDALLLRHEREIEELIRWDETRAFVKLTGTSSTETIRGGESSSTLKEEKKTFLLDEVWQQETALLEWETKAFGSDGVCGAEERQIIHLARKILMDEDVELEEDGSSELEDMFGEVQSSEEERHV